MTQTQTQSKHDADAETETDADANASGALYRPTNNNGSVTVTDAETETEITVTETVSDAENHEQTVDTPSDDPRTELKNDEGMYATSNVSAQTQDKRIQACISPQNVNGMSSRTDIHGSWISDDDKGRELSFQQSRAMKLNREEQAQWRKSGQFRLLRGICKKLGLGHGVRERAGKLLREAMENERDYANSYTGEALLYALIEEALEEFNHPFPREELKSELEPANYKFDFDDKVEAVKDDLEDRNVYKQAETPRKAWLQTLADRLELDDRVVRTARHFVQYAEQAANHRESHTYGGTAPNDSAAAILLAVKKHDGTEYGYRKKHCLTGGDIGPKANLESASVSSLANGYEAVLKNIPAEQHVEEIAASHRDSEQFSHDSIEQAKEIAEQINREKHGGHKTDRRNTAAAVLYYVLDENNEYEYTAATFGKYSSVDRWNLRAQVTGRKTTIPIEQVIEQQT